MSSSDPSADPAVFWTALGAVATILTLIFSLVIWQFPEGVSLFRNRDGKSETLAASTSTGVSLEVGDCMRLTAGSDDMWDISVADCTDKSGTSLFIAKIITDGSECDKAYSTFRTNRTGRFVRYCLIEEMQEGSCYTRLTEPGFGYARINCGDSRSTNDIKLVLRSDRVADQSLCASGTRVRVFPEAKRTYCTTQVKG